MVIEYTGRNTTVHSKFKSQTETAMERIARVTGCVHAHVFLTEDKYRTTAEVVLQCRGERITARVESANDMDKALHDALMKVEQQAVKHKDRVSAMRVRGGDIRTMQVPAA